MSKKKEYKDIQRLREFLKGKISDEELEKLIKEAEFDKFLVRSIRNKSLQKVIYIAANINISDTPLRKKLVKRCSKKGSALVIPNLVNELTIKDIQEILDCNRRTAKDYHMLFKALEWILL